MKSHLLARVLADHLEPDAPVDLPDGTVVELTLEVPEPPKSRPRVTLCPRKLGVRQSLTRESP